MGFLHPMQGFLLSFLLFCVCVSGQRLTFDSIPRPLEATAITISLEGLGDGMVAGERLWIHLPYFGGGYNDLSDSLVARNGDGNVFALSEADWDSHREVLRLRAAGAGNVRTLSVSMGAHDDGLGPLPPRGGIDGDWTKLAWLRRYTNCAGTEPVVCGQPTRQDTFDFVQRFATGFDQLPTKLIGATGAITAPSFTMTSAEGSTNAAGTSNCITVTFVSSVTMMSLTNNPVFVTISGLTNSGSEDEDNLAIYTSRADCQNEVNPVPNTVYRQSERKYERASGTLTLRLETNTNIIANQDYKCTSTQTVPGTEIATTAIPSSSILESRAPFFSAAQIFQATSDPGVDSVIFVTLSPSENIPASNTITLSGLCGSNYNNPVISLFATTGDNAEERGSTLGDPVNALTSALDGSDHEWNSATREMKLALRSDGSGMTAGTLYTFGFRWRLLGAANSACAVTVSSGARFPSAAVSNVGASFGAIADPQFTTLKIGQATTRPGVTNYICVTLQSNADFGSESDDEGSFVAGTITLSGLQGSAAVDNPSATVFRCPDGVNDNGELTVTDSDGVAHTWDALNPTVRAVWTDLPNTNGARMFRVPNGGGTGNDFQWDASNAEATLTINEAFTFQAGTQYVFALNLENGVTEQGCQTVSLSASSRDWSQAPVQLTADSTSRALQDGAMNGDVCPLNIYGRKFLTVAMAQQIPLAEEDNTFTVTLKPNVDLTSDETDVTSTLTIRGLTNTLTSLSTLTYMAAAGTFLPDFGNSLNFNSETGELTALLATGDCTDPPIMGQRNRCMKAGFTYGFTFMLKNPVNAQAPPNVQIGAVYGGGNMPLTTVTAPSDEMKQVLRIIPATQIMKTYQIGQTNTVPGQKNAICVTLATWINIEANDNNVGNEFATVTISGLGSDWQTSTQDQNIWHPDTSGQYGDLPLAAGVGGQRGRAPAGLIGTETWSATQQGDSRVHYEENDGAVTFVMNNLAGETDYPFCFLMTNPNEAGTCKTISLEVSSPGRDTSTYTMTQPTGDGCVGVVGSKSFPRASVRSASNVINAEPTLIMELRPNFALTGGEVIELSGLAPYVPIGGDVSEDRDVPIYVSANGVWDSTTFLGNARFIVGTGALRLTLQTEATIASPESLPFCTALPVPTTLVAWNAVCNQAVDSVIYEIMFDLQNQRTASAAPSISISAAPGASQLSNPEFPPSAVDTGMHSASRRRMQLPTGPRRAGHPEDYVVTMVTRTKLYGGETIVIDLPHYASSSAGTELFGVVSTGSDAFTTFESSADITDEPMGRAFFTTGYSDMGLTAATRSGMTGRGLDGFFVLAESDGGRTTHKPWFADPRPLYSGDLSQQAQAPIAVPGYNNRTDIGATLSFAVRHDGDDLTVAQIKEHEQYRVFLGSNNLAGLSLMCNNEERIVLASAYTTTSSTTTVHLFVENGFMSGGQLAASLDDCMLSYKQHVGVYTGMRGMIGDHEVVFKQGAGPLYIVSDGSGTAPPYTALQGKPYTVYSRLELVAKHGADVPAGTEITITVPGIVFPHDTDEAVTLDTTDTVADKTTISMALVTPLAGATTLKAGSMPGASYGVELTEWRPYVGPAAYNSDFVDSLDGLYIDFFGAMSVSSRIGRMTNTAEVEINPAGYSAGNRSSWNSITLTTTGDGNFLSDAAVDEKFAGSRLLLGMTKPPAITNPRYIQLRVTREMTSPSNNQQTVFFLGPSDGIFSPDARNMTAPVGTFFRQTRTTIEPLGVLGKGFSDGAFYSSAAGNAGAVRDVDLLAAGSQVYDLGAVANMIGGDSVQAVASSVSASYQPASVGSDDSFIYQGPFQITGVESEYDASDMREPMLMYDTRSTSPPQVFGASIRAVVTLMQPEQLGGSTSPTTPTIPPPPPPPNTGGGDECANVQIPVVTITEGLDLEAEAAKPEYPCGVIFDGGCGQTAGRTDGGIGCFQTNPPTRGVLESIGELAVDDAATGIASTGLTTSSIVSKIVRVQGRGNLRFLLRFLFSVDEQEDTGTTIEDVSSRRRLLQSCPDGKEYRVVKLGRPVVESCSECDATCSSPAECNVGEGDWTTMLVDTSICNPTSAEDDDDDDNTGTIIGAVIGGTLGLLFLCALCFMLSQQQPQGRQPKLAPVYLPEEYPVLPVEYQPAPAMIEGPGPAVYIQDEPTIYQTQPNGQFETYSGTAAAAIQSGSARPMMGGSALPALPPPAPGSAIPMQYGSARPLGPSTVPMFGM